MVSTNRGCMVISLFHLTFRSDHARDYCFVVIVLLLCFCFCLWKKSKPCTHLHLYTHTHTHARTHARTHVRTHTHTHACTHTHTHTHTHTQASSHTSIIIDYTLRQQTGTWGGERHSRAERKTWTVYCLEKMKNLQVWFEGVQRGLLSERKGKVIPCRWAEDGKGAGTSSGVSGTSSLEAESIRSR